MSDESKDNDGGDFFGVALKIVGGTLLAWVVWRIADCTIGPMLARRSPPAGGAS